MKWKQFLTPVKSMDTNEAKAFMEQKDMDDFTILDVRQPSEYEEGHIPGATLIPLPDLGDRLQELDQKKTQLVYCAVGGRSRVAAQMMAGKGFEQVINVAGGFKAWNGHAVVGSQELGLELFDGSESPEETLVVAYSLEQGLREYYLSMMEKVKNTQVKELFSKLAQIEVKHQERLFQQYLEISDTAPRLETFEKDIVVNAVEGGMTTEEYTNIYQPDWDSPVDVISLAMSIEAQALDMYQRTAQRIPDKKSRDILMQIAREERTHLAELGKLMDRI